MKGQRPQLSPSYIRSFIFGVEDSLSSTVGLLSGIATAQIANSTIVITGLILIFTEALAMGVGSFLSEQSVEEFKYHHDLPLSKSLPAAFVMFTSYLGAGVIPIVPYILFKYPASFWVSIVSALIGLGALGVINARISKTPLGSQVKRMLILGGSVTLASALLGRLLKQFIL